jgi:hypothetical protein
MRTSTLIKEIDPGKCRTRVLTRSDVARVLMRWDAGEVSTDQVRRWASACYFSDHVDYDDRVGDRSVTCEVLAFLDAMEPGSGGKQAAAFLEFLTTPEDSFERGYSIFQKRMQELSASQAGSRK